MLSTIDKPLISVIVPVYKTEKYIKKCLDSILNQTYPCLQIVVIVDGSPDNCGEICKRYELQDSRVEVYLQEHQGTAVARNEGLKHIKGEFLSFIDSDDWIAPNFYEYMLQKLLEKDADVMRCGIMRIANGKQAVITAVNRQELVDGKAALLDSLAVRTKRGGFTTCGCNFLWRIASISYPLLQSFNTQLKLGEDVDWLMRMLLSCERVILDSRVLYYYNKDNSNSTTKNLSDDDIIKTQENKLKLLAATGILDIEEPQAKAVCCLARKDLALRKYIFAGIREPNLLDEAFRKYLLFNNELLLGSRFQLSLGCCLAYLHFPPVILRWIWYYQHK